MSEILLVYFKDKNTPTGRSISKFSSRIKYLRGHIDGSNPRLSNQDKDAYAK